MLTWYQSHSFDFLVPMDISGVLPLPSPSSSRHCQKRATAVTPTVLQYSDINVLCIQLPKNRHRKTEQSIPSKTQPRTARNCITRAGWSFCLTSTRSTRRQYLPRTSHAPHAPVHSHSRACCCFSSCHVSPRWRHTATSAHVISWPLTLIVDFDRWPLTLTVDRWLPRASRAPHAPVHSYSRATCACCCFSSCHVSPRWRHTATSAHVISWPLTLTWP